MSKKNKDITVTLTQEEVDVIEQALLAGCHEDRVTEEEADSLKKKLNIK